MDKNNKFYITTPIYYTSGNWHIGHCYTTVVCDAFARYNKMLGKDVFFLTGTDEHGSKIEEKAKEKGLTPKEFIDPLVADLKDIWKILDVKYDKFIRTTDDYHVEAIQKIFNTLFEKGEIYKSEYSGWYCTPCESYWTKSQLKDGKCPDCGREVKEQKEESYFFRLSKYTDKLIKLYEDNPEFLQPKSRMNEMLNNFLKPGLQDLCVSRTSVKWGIPVTFDPKHTVYVWIDALSNYITALGYGSEDDSLFKKFWPADIHMTGKEIVRFHAIIWPAILMALGLELPKQVYGHGWLLIGGDKLSKSKGENIKSELTDPKEICERYSGDALRYFLLREIPFGSDGIYTNESFLNRINGDLSNDLGNLVSRTTAMVCQYFGGIINNENVCEQVDEELKNCALSLFSKVNACMTSLNVPDALSEIFKLIQRANKYIDETAPWILYKDESKHGRLKTVLYNLCECIRISAIFLKPILTKSADKILNYLGIDGEKVMTFETAKTFGVLENGTKISKAEPIFPRIDIKKEIAELEKLAIERHKVKDTETKPEEKPKKAEIGIEEFDKLEIKVGLILECEKVEKSDKLLKSRIKIGEEVRTVVSGIAKCYSPEEMVGKRVSVITNLKPVKLRGILSEGMVLCADDGKGKLTLVAPIDEIDDGSEIR